MQIFIDNYNKLDSAHVIAWPIAPIPNPYYPYTYHPPNSTPTTPTQPTPYQLTQTTPSDPLTIIGVVCMFCQ